MGEIDGLAQPMGKLDRLASKKASTVQYRTVAAGAGHGVACCEAASAAEYEYEYEYGGQRGVWGVAGPQENFQSLGSK